MLLFLAILSTFILQTTQAKQYKGGHTLTSITTFFAVNSNAFAWGSDSDSSGASAGASGHVFQTATSSGDNHHPTPVQIERALSDITPEISQLFSNPAELFRRLVR